MTEVELLDEGVEFTEALFFVEVLAELEDGEDIVLDGHVTEDGGFLCEVADTHLRTLVHGVLCEFDGLARLATIFLRSEVDLAGVGFDDAHDHIESGSFSGTIGAEEANDFALTDFDGSALDDGAGAVFFYDVVGVEFHKLKIDN